MQRHLLPRFLSLLVVAMLLAVGYGGLRALTHLPAHSWAAPLGNVETDAAYTEIARAGAAGPDISGASESSAGTALDSLASFPHDAPVDPAETPAPYLLADYAEQCRAYMGTVPEFSCETGEDTHDNVLFAELLPVDRDEGKCPRLVDIDKECSIADSVAGMLKPQDDAPPGTAVMMVFRCRKYDIETPEGYFDDVAVIQHDKVTGNTCWYQVPTLPELTETGRQRYDAEGNRVYKDFDGSRIISPMAVGAESLWLHPYHPDDPRGYVADKNCQRCHDADPYIWTPYLEPAFDFVDGGFVVQAKAPITDAKTVNWPGTRSNYIPGFLGIFEADGKERPQPKRINPEALATTSASTTNESCRACHSFGQNTMKSLVLGEADDTDLYVDRYHNPFEDREAGSAGADLLKIASLINILYRDKNVRDQEWMPPVAAAGQTYDGVDDLRIHEGITKPVHQWLRDCAEDPGDSICGATVPTPTIVSGLAVNAAPHATALGTGTESAVTVRIRNLPGMDDIPAGFLTLAVSTTRGFEGLAPVTVDKALVAGSQVEVPVKVAVLDSADVGPREVVINITANDAVTSNIAGIRAGAGVHVTDRSSLSLSATGTIVAREPEAAPVDYLIRYDVVVANDGPAAAVRRDADGAGAMMLAITLPSDGQYVADASSNFCAAGTGRDVSCDLGRLDAGNLTVARIVVRRPLAAGPIALLNAELGYPRDPAETDNRVIAIATDETAVRGRVYLPSVRQSPPAPDLVVRSLAVDESGVTVVIANIGRDALPHGANFWVDVYLDPEVPPRDVNQIGNPPRDKGLVWGVLDAGETLPPGSTLTLRTGDRFYQPNLSNVPQRLTAGAVIYAQVDSVNVNTEHGAVFERHEQTGDEYNNLFSITLPDPVSTGTWP